MLLTRSSGYIQQVQKWSPCGSGRYLVQWHGHCFVKVRLEVQETIHAAHQGASGMISRVEDTVFWSGISTDILKTRGSCLTSVKDAPSQPLETPLWPQQPHLSLSNMRWETISPWPGWTTWCWATGSRGGWASTRPGPVISMPRFESKFSRPPKKMDREKIQLWEIWCFPVFTFKNRFFSKQICTSKSVPSLFHSQNKALVASHFSQPKYKRFGHIMISYIGVIGGIFYALWQM